MWQSAVVLLASICDTEATETEFKEVSKTGIQWFWDKHFHKDWVLLGVEDKVGIKQKRTKGQKNEENNKFVRYVVFYCDMCCVF